MLLPDNLCVSVACSTALLHQVVLSLPLLILLLLAFHPGFFFGFFSPLFFQLFVAYVFCKSRIRAYIPGKFVFPV